MSAWLTALCATTTTVFSGDSSLSDRMSCHARLALQWSKRTQAVRPHVTYKSDVLNGVTAFFMDFLSDRMSCHARLALQWCSRTQAVGQQVT
jgi:hypothetical protein